MTDGLLLGIDLGTTHAKAAVISLDGQERSHGVVPTPWRTVSTGAEMDPGDLVGAGVAAAREAIDGGPDGQVLGVGVTSMAETGTLLDRRGEPVAPMIAWHDARGDHQARELAEAFGEAFTDRTGLPPSRLCTLSKYRWMRAHMAEPQRGVRWLNVAEWMVRSLGGHEVADLSLASRTGFLDLASRAWWDEVMTWAGAPGGLLPETADAGSPAGLVGEALPGAEGATLTVGGHDHPCATIGAGATRPGDVFDSCGTAEAFVAAVEPPVPAQAIRRTAAGGVTVGWHALPGRQSLMAGFVSGLALQRFLGLLGTEDREALDAAAMGVPTGAGGLVVHDVTGDLAALDGITWAATPGHVWRAALEAIAQHGPGALATIESVAGPTGRLVVAGGWARSPAVRAVKREILGPFDEPVVEEAGARGAALMAGVAAGLYGGVEDLPPIEWRPTAA